MDYWHNKCKSQKLKMLRRGVAILACVMALTGFMLSSQSVEAGEKGCGYVGIYSGGHADREYLLNHPYAFPYHHRQGPHYYHYYFHHPQQEKSPYEHLDVHPAGELLIAAEPPEAIVFLNGYEIGKAKNVVQGIGLLVGKHVVEVTAEGYRPYHQEIEIAKGKRTFLNIKLHK